MIYILSDSHGNYKKFLEMLKLISLKEKDKLHVLGDVISRESGGIQILNYIKNSNNIELILGNHELLMIDFLTCEDESIKDELLNDWINVGGLVTINELKEYDDRFIRELLDWMKSRDVYKIIEDKYLLVHAGLVIPYQNATLDIILDYNDRYTFTEDRTFILNDSLSIEGYTIVMGHTTTQSINGTNRIIKNKNKICIDTGCGFQGGRLSCLRLEDMEEFYIE